MPKERETESFVCLGNDLREIGKVFLTEANISRILNIFDTLQGKATEYDFSEYAMSLPSYLDYGDNISFYGKYRKNIH